jgi:hypothetical protein
MWDIAYTQKEIDSFEATGDAATAAVLHTCGKACLAGRRNL